MSMEKRDAVRMATAVLRDWFTFNYTSGWFYCDHCGRRSDQVDYTDEPEPDVVDHKKSCAVHSALRTMKRVKRWKEKKQ